MEREGRGLPVPFSAGKLQIAPDRMGMVMGWGAPRGALTLAVLDIVSLPSRVVESGIALSIAYVAAENLWRRALTRRWLVTFGFGLIHGLGFASILRDLAVGGANLATSLVSFNLGVESGQILIVGLAFGLLEALRRATWQPVLRRALSAGAMVTGLVWFLQRAGGM